MKARVWRSRIRVGRSPVFFLVWGLRGSSKAVIRFSNQPRFSGRTLRSRARLVFCGHPRSPWASAGAVGVLDRWPFPAPQLFVPLGSHLRAVAVSAPCHHGVLEL